MTTCRRSRFSHLFDLGDHVAAYHALTQRVVMCHREVFRSVQSDGASECVRHLLGERILVETAEDDSAILETAIASRPPAKVDIWNLKLILTNRCNLRCKYCVIESNLGYASSKDMDLSTADRALKMFARHSSGSAHRKMIMLYGGEPLLNWPTARHVIGLARAMARTGELTGGLDLVLETNGTLLTDEIAGFLAREGVLVQVSIDGPQEVHDSMREAGDGGGSHALAVAGFNRARRHGCVSVVSAVFGAHVASATDRVIDYFLHDLQPLTIGLDLLHLLEHGENPATVEAAVLRERYLAAWTRARDGGLYVEHCVRRLRPFIEEKIRWKDCPSCGNRMVVRCDGTVGVCEAFLASGSFFGAYLDSGPGLPADSPFAQWSTRQTLVRTECHSCSAVSICGRGCGYNAHVASGDFMGRDDKVCLISRGLLDWAVRELSHLPSVRERVAAEGASVVTQAEKRAILGKVPLRPALSLTRISQFAEGDLT